MYSLLRLYHIVAGTGNEQKYERRLADFITPSSSSSTSPKIIEEEKHHESAPADDRDDNDDKGSVVSSYNTTLPRLPCTPHKRHTRTSDDGGGPEDEDEDSGYGSRFTTPSSRRTVEDTPTKVSPRGVSLLRTSDGTTVDVPDLDGDWERWMRCADELVMEARERVGTWERFERCGGIGEPRRGQGKKVVGSEFGEEDEDEEDTAWNAEEDDDDDRHESRVPAEAVDGGTQTMNPQEEADEDDLDTPDPRLHRILYNDSTDTLETIPTGPPSPSSHPDDSHSSCSSSHFPSPSETDRTWHAYRIADYAHAKRTVAAHLRSTRLFDLSNPLEPLPPRNTINAHFETGARQNSLAQVMQQVACLQCVVKKMPCSRGVPACTRCVRAGAGDVCLVQRELVGEERGRIGVFEATAVADACCDGRGEVVGPGYTVLVRLRHYDYRPGVWERKKGLEALLLEWLEGQIDAANWVCPVDDGVCGRFRMVAEEEEEVGIAKTFEEWVERRRKEDDRRRYRRKALEVDFARGDGVGVVRDDWWRCNEELHRPKRERSGGLVLRGEKVDWGLRLPAGTLERGKKKKLHVVSNEDIDKANCGKISALDAVGPERFS